jgi:hypothetical protein
MNLPNGCALYISYIFALLSWICGKRFKLPFWGFTPMEGYKVRKVIILSVTIFYIIPNYFAFRLRVPITIPSRGPRRGWDIRQW